MRRIARWLLKELRACKADYDEWPEWLKADPAPPKRGKK